MRVFEVPSEMCSYVRNNARGTAASAGGARARRVERRGMASSSVSSRRDRGSCAHVLVRRVCTPHRSRPRRTFFTYSAIGNSIVKFGPPTTGLMLPFTPLMVHTLKVSLNLHLPVMNCPLVGNGSVYLQQAQSVRCGVCVEGVCGGRTRQPRASPARRPDGLIPCPA